MANTQAFCNQAKVDLLNGKHAFGTSVLRASPASPDSFKAALFLVSATINSGTTIYTTSGEVTGTNYSAGGEAIASFVGPQLDTNTAHTQPSASIVYSNVTLGTAFDAVLIYNDTSAAKKAFSVHTFGSQTVTAGDFTLTMPTNDGTTGLIRVA